MFDNFVSDNFDEGDSNTSVGCGGMDDATADLDYMFNVPSGNKKSRCL